MGRLWIVDYFEKGNHSMQSGLYGGTFEEVCCLFEEAEEVFAYFVEAYKPNREE